MAGTISVDIDVSDVLDELTTTQLVQEMAERLDSRNRGVNDTERAQICRVLNRIPGLPGDYNSVRELADAIAEGDQKRALSLLHDLRPDLPPVRAITSLACGRAH